MKSFKDMREACWKGYKQVGQKKKGDRMVPNCVPEEAPANAVGDGSNVVMDQMLLCHLHMNLVYT